MFVAKRATTKEELRLLIEMWPKMSTKDIATRLDRRDHWVQGMVVRLRKAGANLPRKNSGQGQLTKLIAEVVAEAK